MKKMFFVVEKGKESFYFSILGKENPQESILFTLESNANFQSP